MAPAHVAAQAGLSIAVVTLAGLQARAAVTLIRDRRRPLPWRSVLELCAAAVAGEIVLSQLIGTVAVVIVAPAIAVLIARLPRRWVAPPRFVGSGLLAESVVPDTIGGDEDRFHPDPPPDAPVEAAARGTARDTGRDESTDRVAGAHPDDEPTLSAAEQREWEALMQSLQDPGH